jgi:hypothetical protein
LLLTLLSTTTLGILYWALNDFGSSCRDIGCVGAVSFYSPLLVMSALTLSGLLLTGVNLTLRYPRVVRILSVFWVIVAAPVLNYMSFFVFEYLFHS